MSSSTTTNNLRRALADEFQSRATSTGQMAFGDGGYNPDLESVLAASQSQTSLHNPLVIHDLHEIVRLDDYSVKVMGRLFAADAVGLEISEAGLFLNENLMAVRNFGPKTKEDDEFYDVEMTILF